ncbi:MAG: hypothetical protein HC919_15780, partial [Oscillatoriales cyanobacterium SM2_2_1]|nr:hypothetical protein [Oscillatoriales cyanobacterium SM2_2_1]
MIADVQGKGGVQGRGDYSRTTPLIKIGDRLSIYGVVPQGERNRTIAIALIQQRLEQSLT